MLNVVIMHKVGMSAINIVNVSSIVFDSATNRYTIHGAYATTPTTVQDIVINSSDYLVRIMES